MLTESESIGFMYQLTGCSLKSSLLVHKKIENRLADYLRPDFFFKQAR